MIIPNPEGSVIYFFFRRSAIPTASVMTWGTNAPSISGTAPPPLARTMEDDIRKGSR